MSRYTSALAAASVVVLVWSGSALGQAKPACDAQGRVVTPQKVEGQVVKIDAAQKRLTVRETNGTVHEFQASTETLTGLKVGDRIDATLAEAPKCP